jgi:hypothetical protein
MSVEYEISKDNIDLSGIIESQHNINLSNMASNQTLFLANKDAIERIGIFTGDAISKSSSDIISAINNNSALISIEKAKCDILDCTNKNTNSIEKIIQVSSNEIKISLSAIESGIHDILLTNYKDLITNSKDLEISLHKANEKINIQATENVNKIELGLINVKTQLELQISNITASIQIESLKSIQTLTAQMLVCCCDIKDMMTITTNATQNLIRELENTRVKDALQTANMEIFMKKFQN